MKFVFHLTALLFLPYQANAAAIHKASLRHGRTVTASRSLGTDLSPDVVQVVTAIDKSYSVQTLTMLKSLQQNNKPGEVHVTIFVDGMQEQERADFAARANALCPGVLLTLLPAPAAMDSDAEPYEGFTYISNVTMVRLQIPHIMPTTMRKVIYLDVDLVTLGPLRPLWDGSVCRGSWNTTDSPGICARSTLKYDSDWLTDLLVKKSVVGRTSYELFSSKQFNAGVLLLDLDVLRQNEFTTKIRQLLRESTVNDQDALNLYAMGMHAEMDGEWNAMVYFADGAGSNFASMEKPVIVHYDGPFKPWACKGVQALRSSAKLWAAIAEEWPPQGCESKVQEWLAADINRRSFWDTSKNRSDCSPPASTDKDLTWAWNALPRLGSDAAEGDALVVWTSIGVPPADAVGSAAQLVKLSRPRSVRGLCSTPACVEALRKVGVNAELIWLRELVMPNSLRRWFQDHVRQKLRAGSNFPALFHQAVVLAALYTHGGVYIDIGSVKLQTALPKDAWNGKWALAHEGGWQGLWSACRFPSHASELLVAAEGFTAAVADSQASLAELQSTAAPGVPHWNDAWAPISSMFAAHGVVVADGNDFAQAGSGRHVLVPAASAYASVAELQMLSGAEGLASETKAHQKKSVVWGRLLAMQRPSWEFRDKMAYFVGRKEELPSLLALATEEVRSQAQQLEMPGDASKAPLDAAADLAAELRRAPVVITAHPDLALLAAGMDIPAVLVTGLAHVSATDARELGEMIWVQEASNTDGFLASMRIDHPPVNPGEGRRRQLRQALFEQEACCSLEFFRLYTSGQERHDIMAAMASCK